MLKITKRFSIKLEHGDERDYDHTVLFLGIDFWVSKQIPPYTKNYKDKVFTSYCVQFDILWRRLIIRLVVLSGPLEW